MRSPIPLAGVGLCSVPCLSVVTGDVNCYSVTAASRHSNVALSSYCLLMYTVVMDVCGV